MSKWTVDELKILQDNFDSPKSKIAKKLAENGFYRSADGVRNKRRQLIESGEVSRQGSSVPAEATEANGESTNSPFPVSASKSNILNDYLDTLKEIKNEVGNPKGKIDAEFHTSSDKETAVLMISDTHIGKEVKDHRGRVIYNTEIAIERITEDLTKQIIDVTGHAKGSTTIDEFVILFLGDIVDNESIYDTQAHHIDSFVAEQVKNATKALWKLIVEISRIKGIKNVRVACVRGNHGRTSFGHEDSNWDNVVYDNLECIANISKMKNISVHTQYAEYNIIEVRGHKILLRHNAPPHADTAGAKAKVAGWIDQHGVDAICSGHFHHWGVNTYNDRPLFRNGSLPGSDDLAERMAVKNKPAQMLFGVSKKRLPTFMYAISDF